MNRIIVSTVIVAVLGTAGAANAAAPERPGCFGRDRSEGVQSIGGSVWGSIASGLGGGNAATNADYKADACGAVSSSGSQGCFGQARSSGVHDLGGAAWGDIASDWGSDNSVNNATYKAVNC